MLCKMFHVLMSINTIFMGILETQEINNAAKSVGKFGPVGVEFY